MSSRGSDAPTLGWIGSFQLLERLPRRREVVEYLARQKGPAGFERICMIKTTKRASPTTDARAAEGLIREAKVMMRLDHPNIVRFHDFFEQDDDLVLVCEHFSGLSLDKFVEYLRADGRAIDERIIWHVALSLFEALAHAHNLVSPSGEPAPIFHRDVRPANVLIASDGRVRLTGFAFAQDVASDESTAVAAMYKAPSYVAPEQVRGNEATDRSDTFAAALVVWELLTGRSATRHGLGDFELLKHLSTRRMEPLRALRPDIPPLVTTALDLGLAVNPAERGIGCEEVAGCIRAGLDARSGAELIREAIAGLGPAVEELAGGRAAGPPSSRPIVIVPAAVTRPEATTLPDIMFPDAEVTEEIPMQPVLLTPHEQTTAASTAAPAAPPPPPTAPAPPASARPADPGDVPAQALPPSTPAPLTSPAPSVELDGLDDELKAMRAAGKHRKTVLGVVVAIPLAVTVAVAIMAVTSGQCSTSTGEPGAAWSALPAATPTQTSTPATPDSARGAQPEEGAPDAEPAPVPSSEAVLIVEPPPAGIVYLTGKPIGRTGEPIVTGCGQKFIRVGTTTEPNGLGDIRWLAEGTSVLLRCGQQTVVKSQ